ncbi:MAG: DUF3098 domain-containing protein [Prevotellaceae bacterium]|jgi:hypothetical protein|nr:DUF3098 domain-containing protein [Prevotellaceae bacterium]
MKNKEKAFLQEVSASDERFAVAPKNIILILLGLGLMTIGYILMIGGGTNDPNIFTGELMFSFRRIVLAPILIFLGFVFEIWAIMYIRKGK